MAIKITCSNTSANVGATCELTNGFSAMTGILVTAADFQFDTTEDFADMSVWEQGIKDGYIYPLQGIYEFDDNTTEVKYYESPLGDKIKLDNGKYSFTFRYNLNLEIHKELQKLSGGNLRYFRVDSDNNIIGYSSDGVTVQGFTISTFEAEKMIAATADVPAWSPVTIVENNSNQLNKFGVFVSPDWIASELKGLVPVTAIEGSQPTTVMITVFIGNVYGLNPDGSIAHTPIAGIDEADFLVKLGTSVLTYDAVVDKGDGYYDIDFTTTSVSSF